MPPVRQTNFGAGELSPLLWGRTDLAKHAQGLRRCRDFFISKQGAAVSRPGTVTVRRCALEGLVGVDEEPALVRLVPFVYSDTQSYVLEFGHNYIRFHSDGGTVEGSPGVPYEVVTTYAARDLAQIQWAQSGDVLTVCHSSYPPAELTRLAHASWTLTDVDFSRPTPTSPPYLITPLPVEDVANGLVDREWSWARTYVVRHNITGVVTETAPVTVIQSASDINGTGAASLPATICVAASRPVTVGLAYDNLFSYQGYTIIAMRNYRGRGGLFGWVGDSEPTDETFTDVGQEPNYAMAPPQGLGPFAANEYPAAVCYFEERRVFAGTGNRPGFLFLSATGDYANFDDRMVPVADEALTYDLASRKREDVRSLVGLDQLIAGTNASAWSFGASGGVGLTPDEVPKAKVQVEVGMGHLPFLVVGQSALFARNKGGGVRSLVPGGQNGWQSGDLSIVAQHLFCGTDYGIVDWCYAEDPWGLIWVVRADGVLLSLTYSQADEMWAWAMHSPAGGGMVRNVCSVPEGDEDAVYLVVERQALLTQPPAGMEETPTDILFIERMASRVRYGIVTDDICLDAAVKYDGAPALALSGLTELEGLEVYVTGKDNPVQGPYTVASGAITLDELPTANSGSNVVLYVGLLYQPELETLDVAGGGLRNRQKQTTSVGIEVDQSVGLWAGQDTDHLTEWRQRKVSDGYGVVGAATELVRMPVSGSWAEHGRVALRQTQPLPVTVTGIAREVDVGGE